jgi:hypothetical protein
MKLDILENAFGFLGIFNQSLSWGRKQIFETLEWTTDRTRDRLPTCLGRSWFDGFWIERKQAREITTLVGQTK